MKEITSYKQVTQKPQNSYQKYHIVATSNLKPTPPLMKQLSKLNIIKCFLILLYAIITKAKSLHFSEHREPNRSFRH